MIDIKNIPIKIRIGKFCSVHIVWIYTSVQSTIIICAIILTSYNHPGVTLLIILCGLMSTTHYKDIRYM